MMMEHDVLNHAECGLLRERFFKNVLHLIH